MANKETTTIDKELYDGLQQARKKKPRYFALIAKGADVVGLIVQKKVINDGAAQKAKSECKGSLIIQGICQGEGTDLKFEVVGAAPSISPKKIKDFIEEQTDLTLKPYWSGVETLTPVVDDEAPPEPPPSQTTKPTANETPPPNEPKATTTNEVPEAPPQQPVDVRGLQVRLKKLLERNKELVGKNPELKEKLSPFTKPAADLVMKGSPDATEALDKLERAINAAESGGGQQLSQAQKQWQAEHARIEPLFLEVLQRNPPEATKIRAVMAYATEQADLKAYDKALAALKRLEPLLTAAPESSGPGQLDPGRVQKLEEQLEAGNEKRAKSEAAAAELAAVLEKQSGEMQGALDLAGDIEQAAADLEQMGSALASSKDDDEQGEEEGGEVSDEVRAQIAAVLKKQSGEMQGALDLAGDIEKEAADLEQVGSALASSKDDEGEEKEDEGGGEVSNEVRAEIAAVLKKQSGVMQGALDLAGDIEKEAADLEKMGSAFASSKDDEGEEEEDEGGGEVSNEVRAEIAAVLKKQSNVMQGALDLAGDIEKEAADLEQMGAALASNKDEGEEAEDEEEQAAAASLLERVLDVQAQTASLPDEAKKELQKRVRQLQVALSGNDPTDLAADVEALEDELAKAAAAARTGDAKAVAKDRVSFRRSVAEWRDAQSKSRKQLDQFVATFLADKEVQADPNFAEIKAAAKDIGKQMPVFGNSLEEALAAIDDAADDNARAQAKGAAQKILAAYSAVLDGAEGLHELQALSDDEFGGISFVSELQLAINSLGTQLANSN